MTTAERRPRRSVLEKLVAMEPDFRDGDEFPRPQMRRRFGAFRDALARNDAEGAADHAWELAILFNELLDRR